uniref:ERAP1-like C-terminal domain-containing protein n=1 Tax=Bracon brevicornis TaxID=1563983 RepID=A0A6V7KT51_9HYME
METRTNCRGLLEQYAAQVSRLYNRSRVHILKLLHSVYSEVGFKDSPGDPKFTVFTRIDILSWACTFGHADCVRNAIRQLQSWRDAPDPHEEYLISLNLKRVVYRKTIRSGGQREWDLAWERYLKTNLGTEKHLLLYALECSKETWILSHYHEWATTENTAIRKQDTSRVLAAVAGNPMRQPYSFNTNSQRTRDLCFNAFCRVVSGI